MMYGNPTSLSDAENLKEFWGQELPIRLKSVATAYYDIVSEHFKNNVAVFLFIDDHKKMETMLVHRHEISEFFPDNTDLLNQWVLRHVPSLRPQDFLIIYIDSTTSDWVGSVFYFNENSVLCERLQVQYY